MLKSLARISVGPARLPAIRMFMFTPAHLPDHQIREEAVNSAVGPKVYPIVALSIPRRTDQFRKLQEIQIPSQLRPPQRLPDMANKPYSTWIGLIHDAIRGATLRPSVSHRPWLTCRAYARHPASGLSPSASPAIIPEPDQLRKTTLQVAVNTRGLAGCQSASHGESWKARGGGCANLQAGVM